MTIKECNEALEGLARTHGLPDAFWSINYKVLVIRRNDPSSPPQESFIIFFFKGQSHIEGYFEANCENLEDAFLQIKSNFNESPVSVHSDYALAAL